MTNKVEELTKLALQDHIFVDADEGNDASTAAGTFSTPKQLRQFYVEVGRPSAMINIVRRENTE